MCSTTLAMPSPLFALVIFWIESQVFARGWPHTTSYHVENNWLWLYGHLWMQCLDYCNFVIGFEIGKCEFSNFVPFSQSCFDYFGSVTIP
jgi:hypothetical protein